MLCKAFTLYGRVQFPAMGLRRMSEITERKVLSDSLAAGEAGWLRDAVQLSPAGCLACC